MNHPKIPVIVLTGFLGSGKTTLLNRLIASGPKTAVIINEFGSTPVDQDLLKTQRMPMTVLSGGCLCCQIKGALAPTLKNLWMSWSNATEKPFHRIIIETSGVASPEPILDTLLRERWISSRYHLQQIITTLAIPSALEQLHRFAEARAQIAWADVLLLTHADLVAQAQISELHQQLHLFAPATPTHEVTTDACGLQSFMCFTGLAFRRLPEAGVQLEHTFRIVSVYLQQPQAWLELQAVLVALLEKHADTLLRIKGVVFVQDQVEALAVHAAAGRLYPPVCLPERPEMDQRSRLVFIGLFDIDPFVADLARSLGIKAAQNVISVH
jgi:G3E family GTPase